MLISLQYLQQLSRNYLLQQGSYRLIIAPEEIALICISFHQLKPAKVSPAGTGLG